MAKLFESLCPLCGVRGWNRWLDWELGSFECSHCGEIFDHDPTRDGKLSRPRIATEGESARREIHCPRCSTSQAHRLLSFDRLVFRCSWCSTLFRYDQAERRTVMLGKAGEAAG